MVELYITCSFFSMLDIETHEEKKCEAKVYVDILFKKKQNLRYFFILDLKPIIKFG